MLWSYPLEQILKWVLMISARGANQRTQTVTIWPITGEDPEPSLAPSHYLMWSVECHKNLWLSQLAASLNYIMLMLLSAHIFVQHIFNPLKIPIDPTTLAVFQWYSWQRNHFFRPDENQFVCPFDQSVVGKCSMSRVTDWQEKKQIKLITFLTHYKQTLLHQPNNHASGRCYFLLEFSSYLPLSLSYSWLSTPDAGKSN